MYETSNSLGVKAMANKTYVQLNNVYTYVYKHNRTFPDQYSGLCYKVVVTSNFWILFTFCKTICPYP